MQKTMLALSTLLAAAAAMAGDEGSRGQHFRDPRFRLSGWAEIPSTYRRPGSPVSGQFIRAPATVNGVTPPYQGQPLPGFSGVIPSRLPGTYIGLPDNGYGAQGNSADYILGFYHFRPSFKTHGDGTTSRGPVSVLRFTPFSDPHGLLRQLVHPGRSGVRALELLSRAGGADPGRRRDQGRPAADRRGLRRRVDHANERRHATGWARSSARTCCTSTRAAAC